MQSDNARDSSLTVSSAMDALAFNRRHLLVFLLCGAGFSFDAFNFQLLSMTAPSIAREWSLTPVALGKVFSAIIAGMLVGSLTFGVLADKIGRRKTFQTTVLIFGVFSGLSALSQTPLQLATLQFCVGIGIGGFAPVDAAVVTEFSPAHLRARLMALWALFYPIGGLLAALASSLIIAAHGWRELFLLGTLPAIVIILLRRLIPETPRYLLRTGKTNEAIESYRWLAGKSAVPVATKSGSNARDRAHGPSKDIFAQGMRKRTTLVWLIWFGWSFSYFGLLLWLPTLLTLHRGLSLQSTFHFMVGFSLVGIVGRVVVSLLIERVGRRYVIFIYGICAAGAMLVFAKNLTGLPLFVVGYGLAFFHDGGLSAIGAYTSETYPTSARASGYGFAAAIGRIASIVSPMAAGYVASLSLNYAFALFAAGYGVAGLIILFGPETKGSVLDDTPSEPIAHARPSVATVETSTP